MDRAIQTEGDSASLPSGEEQPRASTAQVDRSTRTDRSLKSCPAHALVRAGFSAGFHRGTAIVEAVIALPVLLVIILGAIQFALIYQAKATLNHASLQAARAGSVSNADPDAMRRGLARGLAPLYSPESSLHGLITTVARVDAALVTDARIRILNPTREAFSDFGEEVKGVREIPNDRLHARSTAIGAASGVNVQDANILKLEVTYGHELKVPLANWFISRLLLRVGATNAFEQQLLRRTRLPIVAAATVRMQSPARMSGMVVSRDDLPELGRIPSDAREPPATEQQHSNDESEAGGESAAGSGSDGSNLADGFFGFGNGHADPADDADSEEVSEAEHGEASGGGGKEGSPNEEPLCTPSESPSQSGSDDSGILGRIASELKQLAGTAWEFVQGFWNGIKGQLGDLADLIAHPVETAKGLYRLAQSFIDAPADTARLIGAALGKDLTQLASCGAYDRGRVLGSYISPAFMLKLTAKLAKFSTLTRALDELKKDFGCASFTAGTLVRTPAGSRAIEALRAGDAVASRDAQGYTDGQQRIGRTFERRASGYYALQTEAETLHVTEEHPFWVQGRGWTPARDLQTGDSVATATGDVLVLQTIPIDSPVEVFNLSVASTESYFVGASGVWVHNAKCDIPIPYRAPRSPSGYLLGSSDGGNGKWVERGRPDTPAMRYQQQVTGAPRNGTRVAEYEVSGVDFDGYDAERNVLIDAKHYTEMCPLADCKPEGLKDAIAKRLVDDARRQIDALRRSSDPELHVEWHVVNREMAAKIDDIIKKELLGPYEGRITVIFTPDIVN